MPRFGAKASIRAQIDTKALQSLRNLNLSAQKSSLTVGFHDDAGTYANDPESHGQPVSVAEVALWHEYGTSRTPARPFFYPALKDAEQKIAKLQASVMANLVAKKENLLHGLARIGFFVQSAIQSQLKLGEFEPLSDAYLARRRREYPGSGDRPLIRSGLLLRSVRFKATVNGKTQESPAPSDPLISPASARQDAAGDLARRAAQKAAAKADKAAAKAAFDAQGRAFEPRKPVGGR